MYKFFSYSFLFLIIANCSNSRNVKSTSNRLFSQAENTWKYLPIQHQGRIKPFDTFSREILKTVYGKETYKKRSAVEVILSWLIVPDFWEKTPFILMDKKIIQNLKLPLKSKYFSPAELKSNSRLALQLAELKSLQQREETLNSYFQSLQKLELRLIIYEAVKTGFLLRFEPQEKNGTWLSLPEMTKPAEKQFNTLLYSYIRLISYSVSSLLEKDKLWKGNLTSSTVNKSKQKKALPNESSKQTNTSSLKKKNLSNDFEKQSQPTTDKFSNLILNFKENMDSFQSLVFKEKKYFKPEKIHAEIFYNKLKPFKIAWIFYLLFLLAILGLSVFNSAKKIHWFILFPMIGWGFHSLGMGLRSYIMSRPPVSNMYETVIWVPWVALIAGFVFYLKKQRWPFIGSVLLSFFCLLITSLADHILDSSLQPLEAVLRSSFWLTTHVLTITMSYSFFFLAFVLGDIAVISYLTNKNKPFALTHKMFSPIYRSIQWGVVLLAAGTILGGIWADYSWGRFWGWDPKESWALVTLLAYLALLHGRLVNWIGPFGMAIGSVMMFFSVVMAWYGVNFVLGAGLHSYGFGSGGVEYVAGFLTLHLLMCGLALAKRYKK